MSCRPKTLVVDASLSDTNVAGLGIGFQHGGSLRGEIVPASNTAEAEALAVLRGLELLQKSYSPPGSRVETDNRHVYRGVVEGNDGPHTALYERIRRLLADGGFEIAHQSRTNVRGAHAAARNALRIWLAGQQSSATWEGVF